MPISSNRRLRGLLASGIILGATALTLAIVQLRNLEHRVSGAPQPTFLPSAPATPTKAPIRAEDPGPSSVDELLTLLSRSQGKELRTLLERLDGHAEQLGLTNQQVDSVTKELKRIESNDPYQEMEWEFKVPHDPQKGHMVYVNRRAATGAIASLDFRKLANPLRELPLEERVARIFQFVEGRAGFVGNTQHAASWFSGELRRIGKDAVPMILERVDLASEFQEPYFNILAQLRDVRAVPRLLQALRETPVEDTVRRCDITLRWLQAFDDPRVIDALIDAVQDPLWRIESADAGGQRVFSARDDRPVKVYPVRQCAMSALSQRTQVRWSPLFQKNPRSWVEWWRRGMPRTFDPSELPWSESQLHDLLEELAFDRLGGARRMAAWDFPGGWRCLVREYSFQLTMIGPETIPMLVRVYRDVSREFRVWEPALREWTTELLLAMESPPALEAARGIEAY